MSRAGLDPECIVSQRTSRSEIAANFPSFPLAPWRGIRRAPDPMTVPAEKAPEVAELQTDDTSGPLPTRDYAGAWRVARPDATCNHAPRVGS